MMIASVITLLATLLPVYAQFDVNSILTADNTFCRNAHYNWPECVDTPIGYQCTCGAGFYWNTRTCISDSVDSRLEFPLPQAVSNDTEFSYALLLNKPFPQLIRFTLSMWLNPDSLDRKQCVFSYKYQRNHGWGVFSVCIGRSIELKIGKETRDINANGLRARSWNHIVVAWFSDSGFHKVYVNSNKPVKQGYNLATQETIDSGGLMVLGQYAPNEQNDYNLDLGYVGSLAHVNIWNSQLMSDSEIKLLREDCTFTHCGDGVEWVDLRMGTRGLSRLRWPSGVHGNYTCFSLEQAEFSCDKYCSYIIGVQCKTEIQESLVWTRTPAETTDGSLAVLHVACPGYEDTPSNITIPKANRTCSANAEEVGVWGPPQVDNCLSNFYRQFTQKVNDYVLGGSFGRSYVIQLLTALKDHTAMVSHSNPVDISAAVRSLNALLRFQKDDIEKATEEKISLKDSNLDGLFNYVPEYQDVITITNLNLHIINNLLNARNDAGWNMTIPAGQEADELLQVIDTLSRVLSLSLTFHTLKGDLLPNAAMYRNNLENIAIKVRVYQQKTVPYIAFPDPNDIVTQELSDLQGYLNHAPSKAERSQGGNAEYMAISVCRLDTIARFFYIPANGSKDNINTPVFGIKLHRPGREQPLDNSSSEITMELTYINNHNVSNPRCMKIEHSRAAERKIWRQNFTPCSLTYNTSEYVECACTGYGFFTATTDMFNENWRVPEEPVELMTLPSYLGCSIAIFLAACTIGMLVYVGTSSRTAVIHKHFTIAVLCNTTIFMIGITLTFNDMLCKTMAILFHYFFLSMYCWMMNEGFNLYISITYTAHNQNTQENGGFWKQYLIGWAVPAVLVSALVGSNFKTYFSEDMCWIAWDNIWIFTGPPLAMICVTLLVMTFAAKENHEVSYTKNETANKMTEYHSNAVWTQIILVTCTWAFAFLSLHFRSIVFKWVFFIFNSAQGAFLFVFYFLLNEEVRSVFKTKEIKQQLGWDVSGQHNSDDADLTPEDSMPLVSPNPASSSAVRVVIEDTDARTSAV